MRADLLALLNAATEGMLILDRDGVILAANQLAEEIWGAPRNQLKGRAVQDLLAGLLALTQSDNRLSDQEQLSSLVGRHLELEALRLDGVSVDVEIRFSRSSVDSVVRYAAAVRELSVRIHSDLDVRETEERASLALWGANDGMWDWDIASGTIFYSKRWKAMLGFDASEIGNSPVEWFRRIHPDDRHRVKLELKSHFEGESPRFESEHRIKKKDGAYLWILSRGVAVRDESGRPLRIAGLQTKLAERTHIDPLTGLPNRVMFMERVGRAVEYSKWLTDYLFAVLFLDLDRFKVVNDSLGHTAGDQLILAVARRIQACVRPVDTVARFGGDEFAVLLAGIDDVSEAEIVSARILQELGPPFHLKQKKVSTSASIGIAVSTTGYKRPEDVMADADWAMYRAKTLGKARYHVFDVHMRRDVTELLKLETDLRWALERGELETYYQPIVVLGSNRVCGFETLLRWRHPERGLIGPERFIHLAEETGLIVPIGRWVLYNACHQVRYWEERFPESRGLIISVNVSPRQLEESDLVRDVAQLVRSCQVDPRQIKLEITESAIIGNEELVVSLLQQLRELQIQVCVDDFGTGYSALSLLHRLPIDMIKIDRSFVARMGLHGGSSEVVRAIMALSGALNMGVIAEGVETEAQLRELKALKCQYWQGFYCAEPMPAEQVLEFMGWSPTARVPELSQDFAKALPQRNIRSR